MNQYADLLLRWENPQDYAVVENLTREAFWNLFVPGCDEHYLVHLLRDAKDFVPELDFVAEVDGIVVGNIMYARSSIHSEQGEIHPVLTFGPVSVLPSCQGRGIGSELIRHTMSLATELGHEAVVIYGDPGYYRRFGFVPAESYGIKGKNGRYSPALQVKELFPDALRGISGIFYEAAVYEVDTTAAALFDARFPPKEKAFKPSQQRFLELQ
jgi:putative acetyltransferase